jgi:hypothetical protein
MGPTPQWLQEGAFLEDEQYWPGLIQGHREIAEWIQAFSIFFYRFSYNKPPGYLNRIVSEFSNSRQEFLGLRGSRGRVRSPPSATTQIGFIQTYLVSIHK